MSATAAVRAAFSAVSALQVELPQVQVMGTAVLFLTMCNELGLDISEVLNKAQRMAQDGDIERQVSALVDYVRGELK